MERINLEFFTNLEKEGKKSVLDFCLKMGFIATSYECPECQKPMKLVCFKDRGTDGYAWSCRHGNIYRRSIRSGSWFQESRLSTTIMMKLAYLWVKGTPYKWIADEFKLSINSVCAWMSFFRSACETALQREGIFVGGRDEIVEIDAKSFHATKSKLGNETWVFGGVARTTKRCFLEIIKSGEENEIVSILQKYVHPGTTIISDSWKGFDCLENYGYVHQKVSKPSGFKDPVTGIHKNNILCLWAQVKKIVSKRIVKGQFGAHLAEVMWRRLHKEEDTQGLVRSFFKILSDMSTPRVRDDPEYVVKRAEIEEADQRDYTKTQSEDVNADNFKGENVSDKDISENESMEEIEVPVVYSKDLLSGDDSEGENGSLNKQQKTMENLDT